MAKFRILYAALSALLLGSQSCLAANAPQGCKKLHTDDDWPSLEEWQNSIPGVSYADVQSAVKFSAKHNIRLTVLTTGHDEVGRNTAGSGLIIDISLLKSARVSTSYNATTGGVPSLEADEEPQVIKPLPGAQAVVTFNPAFNGLELNKALAQSGLFYVGDTWAGVSAAGGFGQAGGYGPLTAQYGLGVDQWLEAKIVTPDGELLIANEVSNPDLFWAIRGGGGGTFGIVVEATFKTYPTIPILSFHWYINSTLIANETNSDGRTPTSEAMAYLFSELPDLHSKGISAYFFVFPDNIRCHAIHPDHLANATDANEIWGPILTKMQSFEGMTPFQSKHYHYSNFKGFYETTYGPSNDPLSPRATAMFHLTVAWMAVGDGKDTSANPGWRKATVLINAFKSNTTNAEGLRELAPDMGTYINEASIYEPDWSKPFWGDNYPRLSAIKEEIDPDMVFWVSPGINANYVEVVDGRVCRIQPTPQEPSIYAPGVDRVVEADLENDAVFLFGNQELTGIQFPAPGYLIGLQP
uniref:FAD-binding PCMH-type domain-containing protein n=1 Tax=Bionectria ochroleuca TaxID=29856 RepID=A0A8H7TLS1_BIOOC